MWHDKMDELFFKLEDKHRMSLVAAKIFQKETLPRRLFKQADEAPKTPAAVEPEDPAAETLRMAMKRLKIEQLGDHVYYIPKTAMEKPRPQTAEELKQEPNPKPLQESPAKVKREPADEEPPPKRRRLTCDGGEPAEEGDEENDEGKDTDDGGTDGDSQGGTQPWTIPSESQNSLDAPTLYGSMDSDNEIPAGKILPAETLEGIYILVSIDILDHMAIIEDNPEDVERKVTMPVPLIDLHPAANWPQALDEFKKQSDDIKNTMKLQKTTKLETDDIAKRMDTWLNEVIHCSLSYIYLCCSYDTNSHLTVVQCGDSDKVPLHLKVTANTCFKKGSLWLVPVSERWEAEEPWDENSATNGVIWSEVIATAYKKRKSDVVEELPSKKKWIVSPIWQNKKCKTKQLDQFLTNLAPFWAVPVGDAEPNMEIRWETWNFPPLEAVGKHVPSMKTKYQFTTRVMVNSRKIEKGDTWPPATFDHRRFDSG